MSVTHAMIGPLFLLAAAAIVLIGPARTYHARTKVAFYPIGIASLAAGGMLYQVVTTGPIEIRFYDLVSVGSFAIPIGLYVDRLSAIMLTLITNFSITATALTIASWSDLYLTAHGRTVQMPACIKRWPIRFYMPLTNRLYAGELGNGIMRLVHQLDKLERGWSR